MKQKDPGDALKPSALLPAQFMKTPKNKIAVVQTTLPSMREADSMSALILKKRLGACIQCRRIQSRYRWKGKIESANEILVSVKTYPKLVADLVELVKKHHPYDIPEIIVNLVQSANRAYTRWLIRETK